MDESRPRHSAVTLINDTKLKSPLIERSDLQSPQQRTLYGALTLGFWALWFYLWLPLLALFAWSLGLQQAFKYMVVLEGYQEVINLLGLYAMIISLLGGGLIMWAVYNIIRFSGVERRTDALPVTAKEIGHHFDQNPIAVADWQGQRRLCVTHNMNGHIDQVEILHGNTHDSILMPTVATSNV